VLLRGTDGAADYLKDVGGSAVVAVVQSNGDAYDRFGAEFARGLRGHRLPPDSRRPGTAYRS